MKKYDIYIWGIVLVIVILFVVVIPLRKGAIADYYDALIDKTRSDAIAELGSLNEAHFDLVTETTKNEFFNGKADKTLLNDSAYIMQEKYIKYNDMIRDLQKRKINAMNRWWKIDYKTESGLTKVCIGAHVVSFYRCRCNQEFGGMI